MHCASTSTALASIPADDAFQIVRRVVSASCVHCHNGLGPAPFALLTDAQLARHGPTMVRTVESGLMPPWLPTGPRGIFRDDCRLTAQEIAAFVAWRADGFDIGKGGAQGAAAPAPALASSPPLSTAPAAISINVAREWIPHAEDPDSMRSFAQPVGNAQALAIRGWKVTRDVPTLAVRYNLLFCDGPEALEMDELDPGPGFFRLGDIANRTSGSAGAIGIDGAFELPDGFAFAAPADATLVAEALSSGRGRPESAGAILQTIPARASDRIVSDFAVIPDRSAPAVRTNQRVEVTSEPLSAPLDLVAIIIRPDMRARSVRLAIVHESTLQTSLLDIPRYLPMLDRGYVLKSPLRLGLGDRIQFAVQYDNDTTARKSKPVAVLLTATPVIDAANETTQSAVVVANNLFSTASAAKELGIVVIAIEQPNSFRLSKTEITQRQFAVVLKRNPSAFAASDSNRDLPADSISWYDATEFCNALSKSEGLLPRYILHGITRSGDGSIISARVEITRSHGYRLPTEAEWLIAACASPTNDHAHIGDASLIETVAWFSPWAQNASHTVATKAPNTAGFHDLFGNVWEWCEDQWADPQTSGPASRIVRGGAWCDGIAAADCNFRSGIPAGTRNSPFGFRIALDAPHTTPPR